MGRYALLVAASDYEDSYFAQLRSPAQDVRGLAEVLRDPSIGGFDVTVLQNAPDDEVRRVLDDLTADRQPDDLVLVYFSCHGLQDIHGRLHFATTKTNAKRPASTAIAASFVSERLEHTVAGGRLLMLDCCYSGAFARGFAKSSPRPLDGEIVGSRGYVCLTACNEYELAYEGDSLVLDEPRPSAFTEVVIEGLRTGAADLDRDGWVETGELHKYVFDMVRRTARQTPSYFAAGLQKQLRVARAPGQAQLRERVPATAGAGAAVTRTPRFFAPRFPPFPFARENRATPTDLAEAMAGLRSEAAQLFWSEDDRVALYEWIDHDVGDRDLERSILRRPPEDRAAAEVAAATFIATFAPHLPAAFRGRSANVAGLIALAKEAVGGDAETGQIIETLHQRNGLRALARHDCSDSGHSCGTGKACARLLAAAARWDAAIPLTVAAARELPERVRPAERDMAAQLLFMILDPAALQVPYSLAGSQRDMPAWWLRLILTTRVAADTEQWGDAKLGRLALAVLTHDAARAERDEVRDREQQHQRQIAAARAEREQLAAEAAAKDAKAAAANRNIISRLATFPRRHRKLSTGLAGVVLVLISVAAGALTAGILWQDSRQPPTVYRIDRDYAALNTLLGLVLLLTAGTWLTAGLKLIKRQRAQGARRAGLAIIATMAAAIAMSPIHNAWHRHVHDRMTQYALANDFVLDDHDRLITSECGIKTSHAAATVVLALTSKVNGACRAVNVYLNGRLTGRYALPKGTEWTSESRLWVTSPDITAVLTIALWHQKTHTWRFVGLVTGSPSYAIWHADAEQANAETDQLKVIRWNDYLVLEGKSNIYAISMRNGLHAWSRECPTGEKFGGLGGHFTDGVGMYCGVQEITVNS